MSAATAGAVFGLLIAGVVPLLFLWLIGRADPAGRVTDRLRAYRPESVTDGAHLGTGTPRARSAHSVFGGPAAELDRMLERADIDLDPRRFVTLTAGLVVILGLAAQTFVGSTVITVIVVCLGVAGPWIFLRMRAAARRGKLESQLADALLLIAGAVRAGHTLMQGVRVVAQEANPPIATEFRRVVQAIGLGHSVEAALEDLAARNDNYDITLAVTAVNVQRKVGGNLAELLERIAETVRERQRVQGEVRALTAQGRLSGLVISLIPVALLGIMLLLSPSYAGVLIDTALGRLLLAASAGSWIVGFVLIRKVMRIEY